MVTTSTEGDAHSRTKTETETTSGVDVSKDDDGTLHLKNTETTRMTKTVASSNIPLPEEKTEAADDTVKDVKIVPVKVEEEKPEVPARRKSEPKAVAAAAAPAPQVSRRGAPQNNEGVLQFLFGCCIGRPGA